MFNYKERVARPIDWIKHPIEDIFRLISRAIYLLIKLLVQKKPVEIKEIDRILIIRRNKLGDAINVLPLLQALKEKYPNITIDVIAIPYNRVIFELSKSVNNIYTIPERYLKNRYLVCFHPQMRKLQYQKKYDLAIGANSAYSSATAWLAFCAPAKQRAGVISKKGSIMDLIYNIQVPQEEIIKTTHQVNKIALLAKYANIIDQDIELPKPEIDIKPSTTREKIIALCPLTSRKQSKWSDDNWIKLSNLLEELSVNFTWIGYKPKNTTETNNVIYPKSTLDFINQLSRYSLVVCSEGGTSHIAPALNCSTIILSGVNISQSWIPWSNQIALYEKTNSVDEIKPEHVAEQVTNKLNNNYFLDSNGVKFNESFNS